MIEEADSEETRRMLARLKRLIAPVLVVALFLAHVACTSGARLTPLDADATILAFGDSLTFGTGAAPDESYPAVLEGLLGRKVVNAGIPGETTAEGLKRLPAVLDEQKPGLVLICLGGNDFLRRVDERETEANLREMVRIARSRGCRAALIGVPKLGFGLAVPGWYREIARDAGIPYEGKALSRILADSTLKSDPIHPSAAGYRRMAEAVARMLRKAWGE